MIKNRNQQGFSVVETLVALVIICLIGTVGWLVYDRQSNNKNSTQKTSSPTKQEIKNENITNSKSPTNPGWKRYESTTQKVSFEYPEGWFVKEDNVTGRIYISSHDGEFNKGNIPAGYQNLWLSTWNQENSIEHENSTKNGKPKCCEAGPVTASTIQAGNIVINTYEYPTVGGPALEAYWNVKDKRFFAHNASEIGNQDSMVATLKKLLPTIKHF